MTQHIDLLGLCLILYGLLGAILALTGALIFFVLGAGVVFLAMEVQDYGMAAYGTIYILGSIFAVIGGVVPSVAYIVSGMMVRRRQRMGRYIALLMGVVALMNMPLGTALGMLALVVLLDKEVEAIFEAEEE